MGPTASAGHPQEEAAGDLLDENHDYRTAKVDAWLARALANQSGHYADPTARAAAAGLRDLLGGLRQASPGSPVGRSGVVMRTIRAKAFVILDGSLLPIDRIAADTPYYSGKHKRHGMNVQVSQTRSDAPSGPRPRCPASGPWPPSRAGASCGNSAAAPTGSPTS
ncbi:hypothetical protein GCM10010331_25370 [Streptomyces xanthochromogenes]|nr:hypothetical protein GCM10010331_25370 [Streptomyces xanthochromogenes]